MGPLVLDSSREGLAGFPAGFEPVARDRMGDVLAVDARGRIWSFEHGRAAWVPAPAFRSLEQLHSFHAAQGVLELPEDPSRETLLACEERLKELLRDFAGAPYAKAAIRAVREDLREQLLDLKFWSAPRGAGIAARQQLGQRCEQTLRDAGASGTWLVRAHAEDPRSLVAVGPFLAPWTPVRVTELLQPLLAPRFRLLCREIPGHR